MTPRWSKHPLSGAEILLDPKRRKVERIVETQDRKTTSTGTRHRHTGEGSSSSSLLATSVAQRLGSKVEPGARAHREKEKRRERSRSRERERERKAKYPSRKDKDKRRRSRSRSPSKSFEEDFGVRKETLLHGSYSDYLKEYSTRSSRSSQPSAPKSMTDIAAAYQKALSQVASALAQQHSVSKTPMDPETYAKRVEEFLAKTQGTSKPKSS